MTGEEAKFSGDTELFRTIKTKFNFRLFHKDILVLFD